MAYQSEAYDFSLFEERNAAPVLDPQIEEQPQRRDKVVELPEQQPQQEPRKQPKHSPFKRIAGALCFSLLFLTGITAVYSEVQLTELTEKMNEMQGDLSEAQSLEIQLNMQAAQRMSDAQVEDYAVQQLGMGKLAGSQVVYMHVARQDKGTVVQEIAEASWLDKLLETLRGWLAR
jgi:hypothetical protein